MDRLHQNEEDLGCIPIKEPLSQAEATWKWQCPCLNPPSPHPPEYFHTESDPLNGFKPPQIPGEGKGVGEKVAAVRTWPGSTVKTQACKGFSSVQVVLVRSQR